jgi:hypothetical protein
MARIEREPLGRAIDRQAGATEHEQVEIELPRSPAPTVLAAEGALELLQGHEEGGRAGRRVRTGRNVERHDRVPEGRLVDHPDGLGHVQARHGVRPHPGQGDQRADGTTHRLRHLADVRPEADVCPDAFQVAPPALSRLCRVTDVAVLILHPEPVGRATDIERWVASARAAIAERHRVGFLAAGATDVTVVTGPPDGTSFGSRLKAFIARRRPAGLIVLGSGAIPLATGADRRAFVTAAAASGCVALANNRFSADVIAVATARNLAAVPDLATDNALPRWLSEVGGYEVTDLRRRWRLGFDIDGPLELVLLGRRGWLPSPPAGIVDRVAERLACVRAVAHDPRRELVVVGRTSSAMVAWLERSVAARTRVLIEERGLRTAADGQRPPRSILGGLLARDGPGALGSILAELGDAAVIDTRVLLAHEIGASEARWPPPADRFASDLLLHESIRDERLRVLTRSAAEAEIPVVLGGHSLVGPGLPLALGRDAAWT